MCLCRAFLPFSSLCDALGGPSFTCIGGCQLGSTNGSPGRRQRLGSEWGWGIYSPGKLAAGLWAGSGCVPVGVGTILWGSPLLELLDSYSCLQVPGPAPSLHPSGYARPQLPAVANPRGLHHPLWLPPILPYIRTAPSSHPSLNYPLKQMPLFLSRTPTDNTTTLCQYLRGLWLQGKPLFLASLPHQTAWTNAPEGLSSEGLPRLSNRLLPMTWFLEVSFSKYSKNLWTCWIPITQKF